MSRAAPTREALVDRSERLPAPARAERRGSYAARSGHRREEGPQLSERSERVAAVKASLDSDRAGRASSSARPERTSASEPQRPSGGRNGALDRPRDTRHPRERLPRRGARRRDAGGPALRLPGDEHGRLREGAAGDAWRATSCSCASTGTRSAAPRWSCPPAARPGRGARGGGAPRAGRGDRPAAGRSWSSSAPSTPARAASTSVGGSSWPPTACPMRLRCRTSPRSPSTCPPAEAADLVGGEVHDAASSLALLLARDRLLPRG